MRVDHADEAERLIAERLEAVQLIAFDIHGVARPDVVGVVSEGDAGTSGDDHDAVIVWMALAGGAPRGRHVEIAHAVGPGTLARRSAHA